MNKQRIEKLWETLRSDEFHISHKDALIELCEALMDEEEQPDHSGDTGNVA